MKIARREFLSMYVVLAFTHVFCRIFLTEPLLVSSAWMPLLLAFIAALPPIMFARTLMGVKQPIAAVFDMALGRAGARIWYALALVMQLIGANIVTNLFSASVMAYANDIPIDRSIIVLTLAVAGLGAYIGETALANCARITLRLAILILGGMALYAFSAANVGNFFPLLGPGVRTITANILPLSGALITPMLYLFCAETRDSGMKHALIKGAAISAFMAAACLAIYTLSQPTLPSVPQSFGVRIALLINNGNSGIQLPLPLIMLWNACQLLLISSIIAVCGTFLKLLTPRADKIAVPIVTIVEAIVCIVWPNWEPLRGIFDAAVYPLITLGFAAASISYAWRTRRAERSVN